METKVCFLTMYLWMEYCLWFLESRTNNIGHRNLKPKEHDSRVDQSAYHRLSVAKYYIADLYKSVITPIFFKNEQTVFNAGGPRNHGYLLGVDASLQPVSSY